MERLLILEDGSVYRGTRLVVTTSKLVNWYLIRQ